MDKKVDEKRIVHWLVETRGGWMVRFYNKFGVGPLSPGSRNRTVAIKSNLMRLQILFDLKKNIPSSWVKIGQGGIQKRNKEKVCVNKDQLHL